MSPREKLSLCWLAGIELADAHKVVGYSALYGSFCKFASVSASSPDLTLKVKAELARLGGKK
jgi:hypothetical protein